MLVVQSLMSTREAGYVLKVHVNVGKDRRGFVHTNKASLPVHCGTGQCTSHIDDIWHMKKQNDMY